LKQQYICPQDANEIVERDQMVKGYEFAKGQYVTFTEEELKALDEQSSEAIEITEFVKVDKVDPIYFDKAYYLGPDKGAERAYKLLVQAMRETSRCALAKYAARGKQYLVMLRPIPDADGIVMQQLRYADEVKPFADVPIPDASIKDHEMKLAIQLIDQIATESFAPEKYEDDVRKRQQALIQKKIEGEEVRVSPVEAPAGKIIDLMEALKASLTKKAEGSPAAQSADDADRKGARRAPRAVSPAKTKASKD
jgi:DNA end-binding protein Ku